MKKRWIGLLAAAALLLAGCGGGTPPEKEVEPEMTFRYSASINDGRAEDDQILLPDAEYPELPNVFGDNMLFQCDEPFKVWGIAPASSKVEIRLRRQESGKLVSQLGLIAYDDGSFIGELPAVRASFTPYKLEIKIGSYVKTLKNVLFGELILASGQSNMQVTVGELYERDALLAGAQNPNIRYYNPAVMPVQVVDYVSEEYPFYPVLSPDLGAQSWGRGDDAGPMGVAGLSGIAYTCALELYERLNANGADVPVGVMSLPVGGTAIAPWLPRFTATRDAEFRALLGTNFAELPSDYNRNATYKAHAQFSSLYNTKIAPVTNMKLAGMLWYQGESDEGAPDYYAVALEKLISSWSEAFGREDGDELATVMCQLAPFHSATGEQNFTYKPVFNEVFTRSAQSSPATRAVVPTYDQDQRYERSDNEPIHPKVKEGIGRRCGMALWSLVYGGSADLLAPEVSGVTFSGGTAELTFAHAGAGLSTSDGLPARGFAIAGGDGIFYDGKAELDGDTVRVTSPEVTDAKYVTYAFTVMNVSANLQNAAGVAALPYRSAETKMNWCQHDWLSCDLLKLWRYVREDGKTVGRDVPLWTGQNCTLSLTDEAVHGRALSAAAQGTGSFSVSAALGYPQDIHCFNAYKTLTFSYQGTLLSVSVDGTPLERLTETVSGGWKRAVYRLDAKTWGTDLSALTFSFSGSTAKLDEMDLGSRLPA